MKDNLDFYRDYEEKQAKELEKFPVCSCCGEYITDEFYYNIEDEFFCEECLKDNFRKSTDDYLNR